MGRGYKTTLLRFNWIKFLHVSCHGPYMRDALYYIRQHITNPLNKQTLDGYIGFEVRGRSRGGAVEEQIAAQKKHGSNLILIGLHRS